MKLVFKNISGTLIGEPRKKYSAAEQALAKKKINNHENDKDYMRRKKKIFPSPQKEECFGI